MLTISQHFHEQAIKLIYPGDTQDYVRLVNDTEVQYVAESCFELGSETEDYLDFLDLLIKKLNSRDASNVLAAKPRAEAAYSLASYQRMCLRGSPWKTLYARVGAKRLQRLLCCYRGFVRNKDISPSKIQIFGPELVSKRQLFKQAPSSANSVTVSNHRMLFRNAVTRYQVFKLIPETAESWMIEMFHLPSDYAKSANYRRKYGKIYKILKRVVNNRLALLKQIKRIWYNMPFVRTKKSLEGRVFSKAFPQTYICNFIKKAVAVLPRELFGSRANVASLMKSLSKFLSLPKKMSIDASRLLQGFKTHHVAWLSQSAGKNAFESNNMMLKRLIAWFFSTYVTGLVGAFCHVTQVTNSPVSYLYYAHADWRHLRSEFFAKFSKKYLTKSHTSNISSRLLGDLKFFPKKDELRPIFLVNRGRTSSDKIRYMHDKKTRLQPAKAVLKYLLKNDVAARNVVNILSQQNISSVIRSFPFRHFVKFDVSRCYDSLPINRIYEIVQELLAKYTHFVYDYTSQSCVPLEKFEAGNYVGFVSKNGSASVDNSQIVVLPVSQVLKTVHDELFEHEAYVDYCSSRYTRKVGVFQGLKLSAIFCDLFFKTVLETELVLGKTKKSKILRYADDFLVISRDSHEASRIYQQITGFLKTRYNVLINQEKTISNLETVQEPKLDKFKFCGMYVLLEEPPVAVREHLEIKPVMFRGSRQIVQAATNVFVNRMLKDHKFGSRYVNDRMRQTMYKSVYENLKSCSRYVNRSGGNVDRFHERVSKKVLQMRGEAKKCTRLIEKASRRSECGAES